MKTIYETRDELIARIHKESKLTGVGAFFCLLKSWFLVKYRLVETPDELIARNHAERLMNSAEPEEFKFSEPDVFCDPLYSSVLGNAYKNDD